MTKFTITTFIVCSLAIQAYSSNSPIGFIANKGQLTNTCGELNDQIKYIWNAPASYKLLIRDTGFSYDTYRQIEGSSVFQFHRLDVDFMNSSGHSALLPYNRKEEYINYNLGKEVFEEVPVYNKVKYRDVYPGIDIVAGINQKVNRFKYDFILEEGADVSQIKIKYSGFDSFKLENGHLSFQISGATVQEYIPKSWIDATGELIQVEYQILENTEKSLVIGFELCDDSAEKASMVIDPEAVVEWATYHGDSLADVAEAIVTDSLGNVFITGTTSSLQMIASDGSYQNVYSGGESDAYLLKLNQHGLRHWSTYYGGTGSDKGLGICVDEYDYIYITGSTNSPDSIGSEGAIQSSPSGGTDAFVAKFNRLGELIWDTYIGGEDEDLIKDCFVFNKEKVHLAGETRSESLLENLGLTPENLFAGEKDLFVVSLSSNGELLNGNYFGGNAEESLAGIDADSLGNIAFCANTSGSSGLAFNGPYQSQASGGSDGYFFLTDSSYSITWASYFGTEDDDYLTDIAISDDGVFVYLSGYSSGNIDLSDTASVQASPGGLVDGFLAKFNQFDNDWFTYLGGSQNDYISAIDLDSDSALFAIGTTFSDSGVVDLETDSINGQLDTLNNFYAGGGDLFVAKYNIEGPKTWSNYYGGSGLDSARSADVFGVTAIFMAGSTNSDSQVVEAPGEDAVVHQSTYGGGNNDAHLMRWTTFKSTLPGNVCIGDSSDGNFGGGGGYGLGNNDDNMDDNPDLPLAVCLGDSITLTISGGCLGTGAEWVWYADTCGGTDNFVGEGTSVTVAPDTTTYYYIRAESIYEITGCVRIRLIVEEPIEVQATVSDSVCTGEPLQFFGEGAMFYSWVGPDTISLSGQNPIIDSAYAYHSGQYILNGSGYACTDSDTIQALVYPGPSFDYTLSDPTCTDAEDGSITMAPLDSNIVEFYWLDDSLSIDRDSLPEGIYSFYIEDDIGCILTPSVQLTDPPNPIDSLNFYPDTCQNSVGAAQIFLFDSLDIYTTVWYSIDDSSEITNPLALAEGLYLVSAISNQGCEFSETFSIGNYGEFNVNILQDSLFLPVLETGEVEFVLNPDQENPSYNWSPIWGLDCSDCPNPIFNPGSTTTYTLTVTSQLGCSASDSVFVEREIPPPTSFIPNMFSPNNDGLNDELCAMGYRLEEVGLKIYDSNGKLIFETKSQQNCWDGTVQGKDASGTFLYVFSAIDEEGKVIEESGSVTIVR
jgi:gliding motility-associated-like protein